MSITLNQLLIILLTSNKTINKCKSEKNKLHLLNKLLDDILLY